MRQTWSLACLLATVALVSLSPAHAADAAASPWRETDWPFLRDAWPNGRAFACAPHDCGVEVSLTARVKIGFCDCANGVAADDEVDRVGDVDLVARDFAALGKGEPVAISGINGRKRLYFTKEPRPRQVLVFAGGRNCNAFVAMAISESELSPQAIAAARSLLDTPAFMRWVEAREDGE